MFEEVREFIIALPPWAQIIGILLASIIAANLVEVLSSALLNRSQQLTERGYDQVLVEEIRTPLYVTIFLGGFYLSVLILPDMGIPRLEFFVTAASLSIILALWAYAVSRFGRRIINLTNDSPEGREIAPIFANILTFFVVLVSFFVLLSIWQVDITPLLASAGVLGIIIGIAAQDSISNFIGGISLYTDKTYQLGDMVQLETGERGTVIDMSIRSTTILTPDNIAITIPNAVMNSTQVINESAPVRRRRIRIDVGVAYESDLNDVDTAMLQAATEEDIILETPRPRVRFQEFSESAIIAQLQCYINHPAQRAEARNRLIRAINSAFDEARIKIPFPQREVTFFESENRIAIEPDELEHLERREREQDGRRGREHVYDYRGPDDASDRG